MGANQTLPKNRIDLTQWHLLRETIDPRYGQIKVYTHQDQTVCYINRVTNLANLPSNPIQLNMHHANLLKLHFFDVQVQKELCSSFQKITLIYEYLTNDLKQNIQLRAQKQVPYTLPQLWGLAHALFSVTSYLKSNHIFHRDLLPANILLDNTGTPKIQDLTLLNKHLSGYHQVALGIREEYHLSPEELEALADNRNIADPETSDIFQIGLTLLEAATLDSINDIYSKERVRRIDTDVLESKLKDVKEQYDTQFQQFISKALDLSADRGTFEEYLEYLQNIQCEQNLLHLAQEPKKVSPKPKKFTKSSQKTLDRNIWFVQAQDEPLANTRLKSQQKMNSSFNSQPSNLNLVQTSTFNAVDKHPEKSSERLPPKPVENMQLPAFQEVPEIAPKNGSFRAIEKKPESFHQTLPAPPKPSKHSIQNSEIKINRQALQQISSQNQISKTQNDEIPIQKGLPAKLNYQNVDIYRSPPQRSNPQPIQFSSPQMSTQQFSVPQQQYNPQYKYQPIMYQPQAQPQAQTQEKFFFQSNTPATTKVQTQWKNPSMTNDIDSRIEEVLNKSKQALARFNSTISHMPPQQRQVVGRQAEVTRQAEVARPEWNANANAYMNVEKKQGAGVTQGERYLNDDYIQKILAQAHYEIERSQKANGVK